MSEKLGKIEHDLFKQFISQNCGFSRQEVSTGPDFGVDVSVVDLPGNWGMAMTSDPLSLIPSLGLQESAWLSVQLMANDMATTGFAPTYGQFVLNLPASFSKADFKIYWEHIHQYCANIGIAITGGHTGFIEGQNSTIAGGGTFTTIAPKELILVSKMAKPGDAILVTKQCAMSSAAILAMSFPETVSNKAGKEVQQKAAEAFFQTSSLEDAIHAVGSHNSKEVTAMHDVTEGGVLGAIYEMAIASGNGAIVYNEKLPKNEIQSKVCKVFDLDPRFCIGAGSMIITCKPEASQAVINRLAKEQIACAEVGRMTSADEGIKLQEADKTVDLPYFEEDPYWAAFFNAFKQGLK
ncbi:hydrogenase maturation factor [Roseivirga pacifica]|uniref:Hydrogenase maturation factor n=1 Tax=Roseivirga pacifica TaxID=1267423 RepID=A0A1I0QQC2_9BACT|nr:AIR synthase family protein [Roseivirga pacifica]RKQ42691.1 hydrogenase maturation factor [Roseivirga pacifica]SEW29655.1 Hydrogenase maturation factor [Roseivirga pacifica]